MTVNTIRKLQTILSYYQNQMTDAADTLRSVGDHTTAVDYEYKAADAQQLLSELCGEIDADVLRWYEEAEQVKQLLISCCCNAHGATIEISVTHDDGLTAYAKLFDHAALVPGLIDALDHFQSEL